jgi:hypothetical protein
LTCATDTPVKWLFKIVPVKNSAFYEKTFEKRSKGAEKLELFPDDVLWFDKPNLIWIGDYALENDALVGAKDDSIVIARKSGLHAFTIKIQEFTRESGSIDRNRPFSLKGLRVSFGERADRYVVERLITQAEQDGTSNGG